MIRLALISFLILCTASISFAQDPTQISQPKVGIQYSFAPTFSMMSGYTNYELNIRFADVAPGGADVIRTLRSLLEFPLDMYTVGAALKMQPGGIKSDNWSITFEFNTIISDPDDLMFDSDWSGVSGNFTEMFSYTESRSTASGFTLNLEGKYLFLGQGKNLRASLLAGARYQKFNQSIDNFAGWQLVGWEDWFEADSFTVNTPQVFAFENLPAIDYEVKYIMPKVGLSTTYDYADGGNIDLYGAFLLVFASDFDDHILRLKTGEGKGNGNGFEGGVSITIPLIFRSRLAGITINGNILTLNVNGSQRQTWYDDPNTPEDDWDNPFTTIIEQPPASVGGIPYKFSSTQYNVGVRFFVSLF